MITTVSSKAINDAFPGQKSWALSAIQEEKAGLKRPDVLKALADFQAYMLTDPRVGRC